jgi:DHA1 family bicyclomycin/chloramphenicol resistance-like MFS transporter
MGSVLSRDRYILGLLPARKGVRLQDLLNISFDQSNEFTNVSRRPLLLTLIITCSLGQVASTIYVPSVPAIASALETSVSRVQLTFVAYLAAFAVSMLVLGPLSDRCGRKRTMILGVSVSALGSIACAASPTIGFLIGARILQGIGLSGGMVVGRATIRDLYGEDGAAQIIAGLSIVLTLLQAFAPIPGGYLQAWFGWRASFAAVAILSVAALALVLRYVPESSHRQRPCRPQTAALLSRTMLASYRGLIQTRRFVKYALTAAGAHAGFHIFAAGAPAVLISGFGIPPQDYGYYAALPPMGYLIGSFLSSRLTRRIGVDNLIVVGSAILIPAGITMVTLTALHFVNPYAIVGPMILICCGSGLITPNAVAGSLGVKVGIIGAASGLASFLQMIGAAGATAALSVGDSGNPIVLAVVIASAGLFAVTSFASLGHFVRLPVKTGARASV